ncbi:MAG: ATP-binding protein [Lentimicrobiaceae bacterium]|nr:ATP-binding protein [Lentimicrobiaceae bacterium]
MDKQIIKQIILEKQAEIQSVKLINRHIELEDSVNYIFVGIRRAGKSYMLYQQIKTLINLKKATIENILFINFEDERLSSMKAGDLNIFLECYEELYAHKPLVFLDEIQNVNGWEKFARRLADSKYRVFITGSNAKMLSKEMYTTLGGRYIAIEIFPFSFREYLTFNNINVKKNWEYDKTRYQVAKIFDGYFYFGGFAELFPLKDKRSWLNSLYQKILLGDIIYRNDIRNENAIRVLAKKLAESVMQPSSLSRIKNIIDSTGANIARNTLVDYLRYLSDAYLIFEISNFSSKLSEKETFKKRYFYDNGLLNIFLFNPETKLLENLVAVELKKKYGENVYFYHKNIEVDFFIPQEYRAVQVAYNISDINTRQREVKALLKLAEVYNLKHLEIITWDEESVIEENNTLIKVIPVWKWVLLYPCKKQ